MKGLCHTCIYRSEPTKAEHRKHDRGKGLFGRGDLYAPVKHRCSGFPCADKRKKYYFRSRAANRCKYYRRMYD